MKQASLKRPAAWTAGGRDLPGWSRTKFWSQLWGYRGYLLLASDLLIFFFAIILAYYWRYSTSLLALIPPSNPDLPPVTPFLKAATLLAISWLFLLARGGAYRRTSLLVISRGSQLRNLVISGLYAFGFLMIFGVLYHGLLISRVVYLLAFILALLGAIGARMLLRWLENYLAPRNLLQERLVIIGPGRRATEFLHHLQSHNPALKVVGSLEPNAAAAGNPEPELSTLGTLREIDEVFRHTPFDGLLLIPDELNGSPESLDRELIMLAVNFCESHRIPFYIVPDALGTTVTRREIGVCQDYPVIELRDAFLHPVYKIVKRLMDIAVSIVVLVVGLPLWLLIALAIKLTSPGRVIYVQERVGLGGKPFRMYKFRSMVENADAQLKEMIDFETLPEPVFNIKQDPRVTPVGRFLRSWSLDEVPQFFNVLLGAMSLVGPRPERVELVEKYNLWQRRRLKAKPGITGYQQIMNRGIPSLEKRAAQDLYYLKHQSLWLDLLILAQTIVVVLRRDGLK